LIKLNIRAIIANVFELRNIYITTLSIVPISTTPPTTWLVNSSLKPLRLEILYKISPFALSSKKLYGSLSKCLNVKLSISLLKNILENNILAITFTNKAAKEMKERIYALVGETSKYIWINTFHSMCVRILRQHIELLGYNKNFTILDTSEQKSIIKNI